VSWPKEYGGRGATLVEQAIFNEELARRRRRSTANVLGLAMGGPTVIAHGTEEQKRALPRADPQRRRDLVPGLLRARGGLGPRVAEDAAVRDGDEWVVTGQKVWTTLAHTRSGACSSRGPTRRAQATRASPTSSWTWSRTRPGPAAAPDHRRGGVQRAVHRGGRIPDENIVGGEGNGWAVAITTLMHERADARLRLQIR
jgi:alkylation response protein AidB-like acyl-CoA dehydrogenase